MTNTSAPTVRNTPRPDPRVRRSTRALGEALVELMLENNFHSITVQSILDRARVGRSTFYAHYRNKHDVLHSSYEGVFTWLEQYVDVPSPSGVRVVPVREFLLHIRDADRVIDALRESGQLEGIWDLSVGFFARIIERRIAPSHAGPGLVPPDLVARMLAGALMEMIKWWNDHRSTATPEQMDATFQALARTLLQRASYQPVAAIVSVEA